MRISIFLLAEHTLGLTTLAALGLVVDADAVRGARVGALEEYDCFLPPSWRTMSATVLEPPTAAAAVRRSAWRPTQSL
eukprot:COSAG01_NODE_10329_length_2192_cov_1.258481_1_plen_78_part_00